MCAVAAPLARGDANVAGGAGGAALAATVLLLIPGALWFHPLLNTPSAFRSGESLQASSHKLGDRLCLSGLAFLSTRTGEIKLRQLGNE